MARLILRLPERHLIPPACDQEVAWFCRKIFEQLKILVLIRDLVCYILWSE
jgi:hypothetical protein